MALGSSKTETESTQIVSTAPIETTTEESAVSSSLNKDKSESDPKENDSSNDEDSIVDDGDSASDQSEWGVDSFDDKEYISPDEDTHTDEEVERKSRLYKRNFHFSHGFLVEEGLGPLPRPRSVGGGSTYLGSLDSEHSPVKGRTQLQYAQDMAKLSLRKYNALNETNVKLDHVVRVTGCFAGRFTSYITFMAKESEEDDTLVEYQAKKLKMDDEEEDGPAMGGQIQNISNNQTLETSRNGSGNASKKRNKTVHWSYQKKKDRPLVQGEQEEAQQAEAQQNQAQQVQPESKIPPFDDGSRITRDWTISWLLDDSIDQLEDTCGLVAFTRLLQASYNKDKLIAERRDLSYQD